MKRDQKDDIATSKWLKANGIAEKGFEALDLEVVQAQKIAHNLLKNNSHLVDKKQVAELNDFLKVAANKKKRQKITKNACNKVMKIGKQANRKAFSSMRKIKRIRKANKI